MLKPRWLVVLGCRRSSSFVELNVMNMPRALLLLVLRLAIVFVSHAFGAGDDGDLKSVYRNHIRIKSTQVDYVLFMVALSYHCNESSVEKWHCCLRAIP